MKYCPTCQTRYTDETLRFCLQDGSPLTEIADSDSNMPTVAFDSEETIMASRQVEPIRVELPGLERHSQPPTQDRIPVAAPVETKKSNTAIIVLLTALVTLLLLGGGAIGAWLFMKNRKTEVAANVSNAPKTNRPTNANSVNNQENSVSNSESNALTPTPTATASPKPTLKPDETKNITADVEKVIDDWKDASENLDINRHLGNYADTVDYYKAGKVSRARVRADKQTAFDQYDSINFNISNVKITPDASGEKATAIFDKEWTFEGEEKYSSGKVQQLLTLNKINGRWLITGEKDLKVYYVDK